MMKIRLLALSAIAALIVLFLVVCSTADLYAPPAIQPKLEDASVNPVSGIWSDRFNYSVNCTFSKHVNITLEVYDLSLRDWKEPKINGTHTYTNIRQRQNFTWNDITPGYSKCNGTSRYRFKYDGCVMKHENGTEMIYYGPEITIGEKFKDATVYPTSGRWYDPFEYSVSVNLSWVSNITLNVFDIGSGTWKTGRTYAYTNKSKWERLTWPNEKLFSNSTGRAKYKFVDEVRKLESKIFYGPRLQLYNNVTFKNTSVTPFEGGHFNDAYTCNCSVSLNTSEDRTISLAIRDITNCTKDKGCEWKTVENKTYNNTGKLQALSFSWNATDKIFDKDGAGPANYRFSYTDDSGRKHKSESFDGPILEKRYTSGGNGGGSAYVSKEELREIVKEILDEIEVDKCKKQIGRSDKPLSEPIITCNVTPGIGRWFKPFRYDAIIKHQDRSEMCLGLYVYRPGSKTGELVKYKPYQSNAMILKNATNFYNDTNVAHITWESAGIYDANDVNKSDYTYFIWYYDRYNEGEMHFSGPKDVTGNHKPSVKGSVTPETGTFLATFEYVAYINDTDGDDTVFISLYAKDPSNKTVLIGERTVKIINGTGNATWVVPSDRCPDIFTEKNMGNISFDSSFYFKYGDEWMDIMGSKEKSDLIPGPYVKPANVSFVEATVTPEKGKYSDKYTYEAKFYSSDLNTITATLYIWDPSNIGDISNLSNWWKVATKGKNSTRGDITLSWSDVRPKLFGPEDFNTTAKYMILWQDTKLYTTEKKEGPWSGPHITNGVPMVGGIVLPLALIILISLVITQLMPIISIFRGKTRKHKPGETENGQKQEETKTEGREAK